ncbi:hypothetical protein I302_105526 [Kwoniella bestiolae CBS 10118]|uniref:Ricin B lectin domain-containing protein n=1 Tax=Kwoniella bestiolae CBS 10118 TaxID=1296100 RepID=A0A1B9FTD7_9TREE|nr:hypothetical protein I302_08809 [Kwoniella bestiolae CBS 10118]OCF22028.1 hypothetical protein I302_08809 [Kwoniella bestiolae CBS 10118]
MLLTAAFLPLLATISAISLDKREVEQGAQIRLKSSQQCVSRLAEGSQALMLAACDGADRWDINDNPNGAGPIVLSASGDQVAWDGASTPDAYVNVEGLDSDRQGQRWTVSENGEIFYATDSNGEEIKVCAEYFDQQLGQDQGYIRRYKCSGKGAQQFEIISE